MHRSLVHVCGYPRDIQANQAAKGLTSTWDVLIDSLESMEQFVSPLKIYTEIPLPSAMVGIMVNIMVELISTLGLVTEKLKQRRTSESVLADALPYSVRLGRSQFYKEFYRGQRHQSGPAEALIASRKTSSRVPQLRPSRSPVDSSRI